MATPLGEALRTGAMVWSSYSHGNFALTDFKKLGQEFIRNSSPFGNKAGMRREDV